MPIKICVGLSKKIGLPEFGSLGASCNVEFEADQHLLEKDRQGFYQGVQQAFDSCRQAVENELNRHQHAAHAGNSSTKAQNTRAAGAGNSASPSPANGNANHISGRNASEKQMEYARQLARQIPGLGVRRLESLAQKMFGKPLAGLTSLDGSGLIDCLKDIKSGKIDLDSVLNGAAV
jgi:hypothetical protein